MRAVRRPRRRAVTGPTPPRAPASSRATSIRLQRRRERAHRVACASRVLAYYGLTLSDWQASSFVLSTATGKTELVEDLGHLWAAAEKLLGRPCDPLDPDLIIRLEGRCGG